MSPDPELLSTTEVARVLGITRAGVNRIIGRGRLPGIRIGSRLYVPRDVLERFSAGYTSHLSGRERTRGSSPSTVWLALAVLSELGECTTAELAIALDRDEGNARKYVLILRQRGFVASTVNGHHITDAGRAHLQKEQLLAS